LFRSMQVSAVASIEIFVIFILRLGKYITLCILRQIWLRSKCGQRVLSWWHHTSNIG
jgi:hypothetical protein